MDQFLVRDARPTDWLQTSHVTAGFILALVFLLVVPTALGAASGAGPLLRTVDAGTRHTCALDEGGGVWCWGWNASGQLGDGSRALRTTPVAVRGLPGAAIALSVGDDHACVLIREGGVYCWGANAGGRLGDGTTVNRDVAVPVNGLEQGVTAVAAGSNFTCAAGESGVVCWGRNPWGQLGDGALEDHLVPSAVPGLSDPVRALAAGGGHVCALTETGAVKCWGRGGNGQLGDGEWQLAGAGDHPAPVAVTGLASGVRAISAGEQHSCALDGAGVARCWGNNLDGQLGQSGVPLLEMPQWPVSDLPLDALDLAAGGNHSCAVFSDGKVWCWGSNRQGQLARPSGAYSPRPHVVPGLPAMRSVANGSRHSCAVSAEGSAYCWGDGETGQLGAGDRNRRREPVAVDWSAVPNPGARAMLRLDSATGFVHKHIVRGSGTPVSFGWILHDVPANAICYIRRHPDDVGIFRIPRGELAQGGWTSTTLHAWATGDRGFYIACSGGPRSLPVTLSIDEAEYPLEITIAGDGAGVVISEPEGIDCGSTCTASRTVGSPLTLAAVSDAPGSAFVSWSGACDSWKDSCDLVMSGARQVTANFVRLREGNRQISAGSGYSCGLDAAGDVWCWGRSLWVKSGLAGSARVSWPERVEGLPGPMRAVAVGDSHACAASESGRVWCWGGNDRGQLGDGSFVSRETPVEVQGLGSNVRAVAAGPAHSCAITGVGAIRCWGANNAGQLGSGGSAAASNRPVTVSGITQDARAIGAGGSHTCALMTGGEVRCWGGNGFGQLGTGDRIRRPAPAVVQGLPSGAEQITAGQTHTCASVNGAAWCWGNGFYGQLGNGDTTPGQSRTEPVAVQGLPDAVEQISAGTDFTCALTSGGTVWCWGNGWDGRLGLGDGTWTNHAQPVPVSGMGSGARAIATGGWHACALDAQGRAYCWGANTRGQLGVSGTVYFPVPTPVIWR